MSVSLLVLDTRRFGVGQLAMCGLKLGVCRSTRRNVKSGGCRMAQFRFVTKARSMSWRLPFDAMESITHRVASIKAICI